VYDEDKRKERKDKKKSEKIAAFLKKHIQKKNETTEKEFSMMNLNFKH
jgi:hypothetical protein